MKAMIISDLLVAKKYLIQQSLIGIIVGVFICVVMGNLYVISPAIGIMIPFSLAFTIIAFDERDNWQQFRLSLPMSRREIIFGRYLSFGMIAIGGLALGLCATGLIIAIATLAPNISILGDLMVNFSWQALVLTNAAAIAIILLMLAITMPLVSRFGMTKAVRYIPLLVIIGVVLLPNLAQLGGVPEFVMKFGSWVQTAEGTLITAGVVAVVSFALYALSGALSTKLYQKREF